MSSLQLADVRLEAVITADWHLSLSPPVSRSCELDWLEVQRGYLRQLTSLSEVTLPGGLVHHVPVVVAGDVFDKWNAPAELINFALESLPPATYAILGNHDIPNHSFKGYTRTAYRTLELSKRLTSIEYNEPVIVNNIRFWGFPYGSEITPFPESERNPFYLEIAIVHAYIWKQGCSFPNAPEKSNAKHFHKKLKGYHLAFFGDNHIPFRWKQGDFQMVNCGSLLRRNSDQIDHNPCAWLVMSDGTVKREYLDCHSDKFIEKESPTHFPDLDKFLHVLKDSSDLAIDFREAMETHMKRNKVKADVGQVIKEIMDGHETRRRR